jgi:hypothetical protein
MDDKERSHGREYVGLVLGVVLILLGVVFLVTQFIGQWFAIQLGHYLWPLFVLVPGILLFAFALASRTSAGEPLAVAGAMITMTGLILFLQNLTGLWATWAYAWALIAPTSIGLGQWAHGSVVDQPALVSSGRRLAGIGLLIFLLGAVFFELVIGLNGFGLGPWAWPLLLILLGVVLLVRVFVPRRQRG